jgi:hypothetical protein
VQGPITNPRNIEDEKTYKVASNDIIFPLGTPVVCHGLDHTPDGKIGNLRKDEETGHYKVHFEEKELKPCRVELGNIRIIFELPVSSRTRNR